MQQRKPLEGAQLVIMTIALSLATFMQVLDSTIANVAIPTIAGNLGASLSQGTWVITSFGVANAISIPITGWLARRVGEVRLFVWSTIAFAIASWACGVSNSLNMLIFFRVIQGIVAGPLIPLSQSLLLNNYPPAKRSIALALKLGEGEILADEIVEEPVYLLDDVLGELDEERKSYILSRTGGRQLIVTACEKNDYDALVGVKKIRVCGGHYTEER